MRVARRWATALAAVLPAGVAGCSAGTPAAAPSTVTATVTVPVTTTVTVAPTVTTWTLEQAAKEYLAQLAPVNAANKALNQTPQQASVKTTAAACKKVVDAELKWVRQLRTGNWPGEVQKDIDRLVDGLGDEIAGYTICAQSYTYESIDTGIQKALSAPTSAAAAQVRAALGLPTKSS
jgi:hypothetical protein